MIDTTLFVDSNVSITLDKSKTIPDEFDLRFALSKPARVPEGFVCCFNQSLSKNNLQALGDLIAIVLRIDDKKEPTIKQWLGIAEEQK